ncbi:MAG: autotransporter assembly complex family protein [Novosphingobium sp.]
MLHPAQATVPVRSVAAGKTVSPAGRSNTASPSSLGLPRVLARLFLLPALFASSFAVAAAQPASSDGSIQKSAGPDATAQQQATAADSTSTAEGTSAPERRRRQRSLEDLIPDSAVTDPEGWASRGASEGRIAERAVAEEALANTSGAPEPDAESGIDEAADFTVAWPDGEGLPQIDPLEPEPGIDFAADLDSPLDGVPDGREVKVTSDVTFVFPTTGVKFPSEDDFIARFRELSIIREYSNGEDNLALLAARARSDEELLDNLLRNYGYYDGYVTRSVSGAAGDAGAPDDAEASAAADEGQGEKKSQRPNVRFDIVPGAQYLFGAIDLGQLPTAPDYEELRKAFEIMPGDPLLADKIVEESFDLDKALGESGYPFAEIGNPSLLIDHDRQQGDLTLPVAPNGRYRFAGVTSAQPDFLSGKHLSEIARFDKGDIYKRSDEMDLRRAIQATGLVSGVTITKRKVTEPTNGEDGSVELDVSMTKAPLRTISGAIGYGTGEGFRLEGGWEHRNFFPPEGALRVRGIAGTKEQLAGVTFRRNNWHGRDKVLTFDVFANHQDRDAYTARTISAIGTFERVSTLLFQKKLTWAVGLEVVATDERDQKIIVGSNPRRTYFIAAAPLRVQYDASDSLLDPSTGFRLSARVSPEISVQNSAQSTYVRTQFDGSYYQSMGESVVLAGRVRVGSIIGTDIVNIAPSRRYYAGGGGSVRGYGYQEIGPRNGLGEPGGGRSLVEFSMEARVRTGLFGGALWAVPFVDAGNVSRSSTPTFKDMQYGAGLGIRYNTGFGPIRVDVATPLNPRPGDSKIGVYVGLGQAF